MSSLTVKNPEADTQVSELATKAFEKVAPRWRLFLPNITIVVSSKPFHEIPELREFREAQDAQLEWEDIQVICPEIDSSEATIWLHYDTASIMADRGYYFQKEFFGVLAKIIWVHSPEMHQEAKKRATGIAQDSEGAAYMAFRDSFSRFFLNPRYLRERKPAAWAFMQALDNFAKQRSKQLAVIQ